jgi:hypothetical protein
MAMTATLAISPSTVIINQPVACSLTVSNSGGSAVNVLSAQGNVIVHGSSPPDAVESCAIGVINLGPGAVVTVPASGSVTYGFSVVFFSPSTGPIGAGSGTFDIGALISASDGSNFVPTAQQVTVNPIALPTTEQ